MNKGFSALINSLTGAREAGEGAILCYGKQTQRLQAIQEQAELTAELTRSALGARNDNAVREECADVLITALEVAMMYGLYETAQMVTQKTRRLEGRLERELTARRAAMSSGEDSTVASRG